MENLKYGIEIEGAVRKIDDFSWYLRNLQEERGINEKILIKKTYDDGNVKRKPDTHEDCVEFKSSRPIQSEEIENHIRHLRLVLRDMEYMYHPKTSGFHLHISKKSGNWGDDYFRIVHNLFFSLYPFVRFFKHRRNQRFCLTEGRFGKILRFFAEDIEEGITEQELIDEWTSNKSDELFFNQRNMLRLNTRGYGTIEIRLFPPNLEFIDTLVNLVTGIYEVEEKLNASEMMEKSLYEVLKMFDLEQDLGKFKRYYQRWIK